MDQLSDYWKGLKKKSKEAVGGQSKWQGQGRVLGGAPMPTEARAAQQQTISNPSANKAEKQAASAKPVKPAAPKSNPQAEPTHPAVQSLPQPPAQQQPEATAAVSPEVEEAIAKLASLGLSSADSINVLKRVLENVLQNPGEPKFRKLRLSNPALHSTIMETDGALELLLSTGFQLEEGSEETGGFAVLPTGTDLQLARDAFALLAKQAQQQRTPRRTTNSQSISEPAKVLPSGNVGSSGKTFSRAVNRPRNTQVVLPRSVEHDVPSWFFDKTGAEIKAAFLAAIKKREESQVLMTRAMREQVAAERAVPPADLARVRVRFPEGVSLQGEFGAQEPVSEVLAWVNHALADPLNTFELVVPGSRGSRLDAASTATIASAGLIPSIVLNFRWTGDSAQLMKDTPSLRPDLLQHATAENE